MKPHHRGKSTVTVPFAMLDDKHAERCHGQTLKRLRERGGLSPHEAICHIERIGLWDREPEDLDEYTLAVLVLAWEKNNARGAADE